MKKGYKVLYSGFKAEITEKKSRFIVTVSSVKSEEEASEFINLIKKKYWDAKHNCFAFVIGDDLQRFSDDGEPSGTAGKPMLDVIVSHNIHDICVVVTRYFGGVLLGTGGLVRAYQKAVNQGLSGSIVLEVFEGELFYIKADYNLAGKIKHIMENLEIFQNDIKYSEDVEMEVVISSETKDTFIKKITEASNGKVEFASVKNARFAIYESKLVLF